MYVYMYEIFLQKKKSYLNDETNCQITSWLVGSIKSIPCDLYASHRLSISLTTNTKYITRFSSVTCFIKCYTLYSQTIMFILKRNLFCDSFVFNVVSYKKWFLFYLVNEYKFVNGFIIIVLILIVCECKNKIIILKGKALFLNYAVEQWIWL